MALPPVAFRAVPVIDRAYESWGTGSRSVTTYDMKAAIHREIRVPYILWFGAWMVVGAVGLIIQRTVFDPTVQSAGMPVSPLVTAGIGAVLGLLGAVAALNIFRRWRARAALRSELGREADSWEIVLEKDWRTFERDLQSSADRHPWGLP